MGLAAVSIPKTVTLWYDQDNPSVSIFPGHIGSREFNRAHRAEGWDGDYIPNSELRHEYWKKLARGRMKKCEAHHKGAQPYTVSYW